MVTEKENLNLNLNEIWRACRKIQSAIFRYGINIKYQLKSLDPNKNNLISESKFINILAQLRCIIGLSDFEIQEITDYFKVADGRIAYQQFCNVISDDGMPEELATTNLEWNDPMHVNVISQTEERRLCLLLTKIAQTVRLRDIVLRPYFQDYELVAKNEGTVTISHFARVLHFMKVSPTTDGFMLLLKKYMKDSYTVNYIAFVKDIEEIVCHFDKHRLVDPAQDIIENFPGQILEADLPKLPRPEIGTIHIGDALNIESSFHSVLKTRKPTRDIIEILLRIRQHIYENRIHFHEFFKIFDTLRSGTILRDQFKRVLDQIGISGLHRLYLTENEIEKVCDKYQDYVHSDRVKWREFGNDLNQVFTQHLEKKPFIIESCPLKVNNFDKSGQTDWNEEKDTIKDLCENAIFKIAAIIRKRRIYLLQFFKDFDKLNSGHVSKSAARRVFFSNGIILSNQENRALEKRYSNDSGFNYGFFLKEVDPDGYAIPKFEICKSIKDKSDTSKKPTTSTFHENDIISVIAKIKKEAVLKRVRIIEFLKDYDKCNHHYILEDNFRRGLYNASITSLTENDLILVCQIFKQPLLDGYIQYKRFCDVIEEVYYQPSLERAPLIVPLQHYPSLDGVVNFLNYDERTIVTKALQKLSRKPDQISNLSELFEDFDRQKCGSVTSNQFLRSLATRDMHNILSSREFEIVCKCFGIERGCRVEFNYRDFLQALDAIYNTKPKYPF